MTRMDTAAQSKQVNNSSDPNVCVGSVLLPSHDVQELDSDHIPVPKPSPDAVKDLKKRATVGSLLLPPFHAATADQVAKSNKDSPSNKSPSLVRRITDKMQGPAPDDADADEWAD